MLVGTLLLLEVLTWIQVYPNVRTAGSGVMQHSLTEYKDLNMSNVMVLTSQKTITNLSGIARQMRKGILLNSRQRRKNHVCICSSVQIVRGTTKLTQISIHFGGINSTESGSRRNTPRSMKIGSNQFAPWRVAIVNNDSAKPQNILQNVWKNSLIINTILETQI